MNHITAASPAPVYPYKLIGLEESGPVLHVTLNPDRLDPGRPDVRRDHAPQDDSLNGAVLNELIAVLDDLHERPDIRVLVLSSQGDDFCLGADRLEFQDALSTDPTGAAVRRIVDKAHRLCQALENTHAITIARLHGKVVGAGLALAAYCDLRAGADTCRFRMPEVGLGLAPAWGGAIGRLIAEAGAARIRELMLTGEPFDAATAHRLNLLHKVAPLDRLDETVAAWTKPLSRRSPEALVLTKRMLTGYAKAARTADIGLLDAHLLTGQVTAHRG